ncbi:hypothetical protein Leryth_017815 [Lithospermum erythrorhizon]|nr:hypothetical protein Leryth_017815 [Lithospermum erythrorhizon]
MVSRIKLSSSARRFIMKRWPGYRNVEECIISGGEYVNTRTGPANVRLPIFVHPNYLERFRDFDFVLKYLNLFPLGAMGIPQLKRLLQNRNPNVGEEICECSKRKKKGDMRRTKTNTVKRICCSFTKETDIYLVRSVHMSTTYLVSFLNTLKNTAVYSWTSADANRSRPNGPIPPPTDAPLRLHSTWGLVQLGSRISALSKFGIENAISTSAYIIYYLATSDPGHVEY